MFANRLARDAGRRGIVLVLILGMLGLLALIGVTFATYAGQALYNARNFNISESRPSAEQYMDFALGQLINDTNNPLSAIRGHSLLRDMYGNDSVFRGTVAADFGGLLQSVTQPSGVTQTLQFTSVGRQYPTSGFLTSGLVGRGYFQFQTNIPTAQISYQYYGLNFTRWIVKIQNYYNGTLTGLSQTFEVLEDDDRGTDAFSNGYHLLTLGPIDGHTHLYNNPTYNGYPGESGNGITDKTAVYLNQPAPGMSFVLDGRYMNAFNGPGLSQPLIPVATQIPSSGGSGFEPFAPLVPFNVAGYANFKINSALISPPVNTDPTINFPTASTSYSNTVTTSFGNPDLVGMDEDYDACDLENWYLALQSADGQVMIPSFHRPSILTAADWTSSLNGSTLYERMNAVAGIAKILRPRLIDNSPQFPPDPSTPDPLTGKLTFDVDNDGDGQTDSVWLDLGYPVQRSATNKLFKPLFAFMVIGQNGRLPLNTVGNLQDRDSQYGKTYTDPTMTYSQYATANSYYDAPTWDHTSHVGFSTNEINPKPALQNAPANVFNPLVNNAGNSSIPGTIFDAYYSQVDNAGVDVALTQIRNLLAGTVPMDNLTNPSLASRPSEEGNFVRVNGNSWWMPNGVIDGNDPNFNSGLVYRLAATPVPGRWGEPEGIPRALSLANTIFGSMGYTPTAPFVYPFYTNPVRAGRSYYSATPQNAYTSFMSTSDLMDDDLDSITPPFGSTIAEINPLYDPAGQVALAAERASRFLTPLDPSGNGQLVAYMSRPTDVYDHGAGSDNFGRISYFRYHRPAGLPQFVDYTTIAGNLPANSPYHIDLYNMPVFPLGLNSLVQPNTTNNQYHSYESFRTPAPNNNGSADSAQDLATLAVMGAMPFDNVTNLTQDANGNYMLWPLQSEPAATMNTATFNGNYVTHVGSSSGPYLLGNGQNPTGIVPNSGIYGPGTLDNTNTAGVALVVNGYPLGSLNKDEADEMNLYTPNRNDQQFGPSDLEWLYRKQDVDGSTLNSRLSSLAPISFLNPADGQTRRRLFSVDSWDPNNFVWANDNPLTFSMASYLALQAFAQNGGTYPGPSAQPLNPYNSRFAPYGNASFANLNQVPNTSAFSHFANVNSLEVIPNPLLDSPIIANATYFTGNPTNGANDPTVNPNPDISGSNYSPYPGATFTVPLVGGQADFTNSFANVNSPYYPNLINALSSGANLNTSAAPITTPALAHRDRRINLNLPLPVANDPAEPVRQKWCRETYQLLKAILPPQSIDTPQELAALSQFVVNIIDFRDPDSTMTRFVNTDLMVIQASQTNPAGVKFAEIPVPQVASTDIIDATGANHVFYPYDPQIAAEQTNPTANWIAAMTDTTLTPHQGRPLYLVQYGMEYNPIAINEVLAYSFYSTSATAGTRTTQNAPTPRLYIELINTLADDTSHNRSLAAATSYNTTGTPVGTATVGSGDMNLAGWDLIITPDTDSQGRPDPITGNIPALAGLIANPALAAYNTMTRAYVIDVTTAGRIDPSGILANSESTLPATATSNWGMVTPPTTATLPRYSYGWSLDPTNGLYVPAGGILPDGTSTTMNGQTSFIPALRGTGPLRNTNGYGYPTADATQLIGDGYFVLGASRKMTNGASDRFPCLQNTITTASYADFVFPNRFFVDTTATTNNTLPPGNQYYWVYLRRPANPFNPSSEMVVVDSFRFPYIVNLTQGQAQPIPNPSTTFYDTWLAGENPISLTGNNEFFSVQRLQPFRGGHHISATPPVGPNGTTSTVNLGRALGHSYGYTEQTTPVTGYPTSIGGTPAIPGGVTPTPAIYGPNAPGTQNGAAVATNVRPANNSNLATSYVPGGYVYDTLGNANNPADANWDFFPFHDRDFNSPAELLMVPGCPPGLFTKEFAEQNFNISTASLTATTSLPNPTTGTAPMVRTSVLADVALATPHAFPYLNDEFYYTAVSVAPSTDTADLALVGPYPTQLGGWTGAGWYKMLDFFEVPSSAAGAIGTADAGENFDWFRQDQKPGLLNLNLIIDEEVFFGLIDDQRLNIALAQYGYYLNNFATQNVVGSAYGVNPFMPFMGTLPQVISQVDQAGNPSSTLYSGTSANLGFYDISDSSPTGSGNAVTSLVPGATIFNTYATTGAGATLGAGLPLPIYGPTNGAVNTRYVGRGFSYPDPGFSYAGLGQPYTASVYSQNLITGMKSAFADFLKLRHGGTNFLFGHQAPNTPPGTVALAINSIVNSGSVSNSSFLSSGGPTVPSSPNTNVVWPDKPYRSLSFPDINYTIMRPALAVPSINTASVGSYNPALTGISPLSFPPPYYYDLDATKTGNNAPIQSATLTALGYAATVPYAANQYIGDPGVRFPWLDLTFTNMGNYNSGYNFRLVTATDKPTPNIPPIPPRRLFEPPDNSASSNAGTKGDANVNNSSITAYPSLPIVTPLANLYLADPYAQLITTNNNPVTSDPWANYTPQPPNTTAYNPSLMSGGAPFQGGNYVQKDFSLTGRRQHPYYRTELLQKVMNLTTVRTHQFAVWITVGFFEVTHVGTPELGLPDILGAELDAAASKNVRFRSFFVIDRTKAAGFNPYYPGEFRNCVTYRRRIE